MKIVQWTYTGSLDVCMLLLKYPWLIPKRMGHPLETPFDRWTNSTDVRLGWRTSTAFSESW
jgi:hypothetical protein